jgi:chromosome segregation ATPase
MVLKAALRQLQKEIREEAPKLEKAQEGERRLREQLEKLKIDYEEDSEMWQQQYEEGERAWNKTKEELLLIGTYVDQLEDRLATFAIAKKEIELREKQCEELEAQAAKHKKEAESWKSQVEALAKEQGETKPLLEDLVKERAQTRVKMDGLLNEITNLRSEIDGWRQKVEEVEQHSEELKSQTARQLFLRIEESKREWEAEASRRIEEQKQRWDAVKSREFQESLENARTNWQAQSAREFDQRLAHEKADLEDEFQDRQAQLQTALVQEWNAKLSQQKADLEVVFQNEMERRLESERLIMQERKEEEFQQRLSAERASWEASPATGDSSDAALLSDEVERAASKVFDRLDKAGISFEMGEPTLKPVKDLVRVLDGFGDDAVASPMDDTKSAMNETSTASTLNHTTAPQAMNKKPRPSGRNVPFRSVRKAFSRATGMHGLITPSTTQIRQRSKQVQRRPGKKLPATKRLTDDDEQSRNDEPAVLQAATDAESENQLWQEESENTSDMQTEVHNAGEDYYQQDSWGYEGGVGAMALMEPPLPDFDDR